ncbi:MAG: nucleoside triphosphate pyrophosphohydrolase [Oceanospirillaceae bacterium]|uniref:nucleoside triphosphate pyrophosphohydrolase n=2 Tax=unclassified Thalassolituus TaxID=2624967 RepID=UPI000C3EBA90|nr:nucleoside triphosphate pyrophosphohydrolase [Thalassolituus sp. UBA6592]MBL34562.1 nucleoside triphosphate pyrophosphohydrolase [Oceanospirillaceae bacterium]MBS53765.1 nucleoside triphosphate pyrophosphohydrolase [Oceanospirillaceae bacterium]|tara:strand:- start:861 stop:1709 length:849 start_codon:yes stop_codon:yes gene_type:complete
MAQTYQLDDLIYLMQRLRDPQTGCPWDLKQDFATVLPHTLEEAYEVADAIERQDWPHVEEELGDLLFQIVFYGQIADERRLFDLHSIIHRLVEKLIRRHPHVFPEGTLTSQRDPSVTPEEAEINANWEVIKQAEKAAKPATEKSVSVVDDVPVTMPALTRSVKLQKKASGVGFDWPDVSGVLDKIREELAEVEAEIASGNAQRLQEEIGDLLFAVTNLARFAKADPEAALRGTNERFSSRFRHVEKRMQEQGGWDSVSAEAMEAAWTEAKQLEKENSLKDAD